MNELANIVSSPLLLVIVAASTVGLLIMWNISCMMASFTKSVQKINREK